jgi:hypothetical protein
MESFNVMLSQAEFMSPFYRQLMLVLYNNASKSLKNLTYDKQRIVSVNIYFEDLIVQSIQEQPAKIPEQLVADLGGFMGLCVGTSLLGIFEIFEIILDLILTYRSLKKKQTVSQATFFTIIASKSIQVCRDMFVSILKKLFIQGFLALKNSNITFETTDVFLIFTFGFVYDVIKKLARCNEKTGSLI